jgi:hypothetical protein
MLTSIPCRPLAAAQATDASNEMGGNPTSDANPTFTRWSPFVAER